jgi:hypothetical protein
MQDRVVMLVQAGQLDWAEPVGEALHAPADQQRRERGQGQEQGDQAEQRRDLAVQLVGDLGLGDADGHQPLDRPALPGYQHHCPDRWSQGPRERLGERPPRQGRLDVAQEAPTGSRRDDRHGRRRRRTAVRRHCPGAALLLPVEDLRTVSAAVGIAVAVAAREKGPAQATVDDPVQQVYQAMWRPEYPSFELI